MKPKNIMNNRIFQMHENLYWKCKYIYNFQYFKGYNDHNLCFNAPNLEYRLLMQFNKNYDENKKHYK